MGAPSDELRNQVLAANLARVRGTLPELAAAIEADRGEDAQIVDGRGGRCTLAWRGNLVASAYDPQGEGLRLATQVPEDCDVVLALGFGTGHHLAALCAPRDRTLLVYEPRLDLLREAFRLEALPFLGRPQVDLRNDVESFLGRVKTAYAPGVKLHVLVHPSLARSHAEAVRDLIARIARTKEITDTNAATVRVGWKPWTGATFRNARFLLSDPNLSDCLDIARGVPAVVCAAGPSLDQHLEALKANRERLFIVAIGQSLPSLAAVGVQPDVVYVVENQDVTHQLRDTPGLENQTLVLAPHAYPDLFELPARRRIVALDASNPVGRFIGELAGHSHSVNSGGSVALCAVWLAERFGANRIALIGQDLAFTGGRRYAADSPYGALEVEQDADGEVFFTNLKVKAELFDRPTPDRELAPNTLWVEGWGGGRVLTDRSYAGFREAYRTVGSILETQGVEVVNCTEGGARIPGLRHETFTSWLEEQPREVPDAAGALDACLARHRPPELSKVRLGIADTSRRIEAVRRLSKRGRALAEELTATLARTGQLRVGELRRLQKTERRLHRQLDELPVLVFQMQTDIQDLASDTQKRGGDEARCIERTSHLLLAVEAACDRVVPLLETLERDACAALGPDAENA